VSAIQPGSNREAAARQAAAYGDVGGICITLGADGVVKFGVESLTHDQIQMALRTVSQHYATKRAADDRRRPDDLEGA
jgi:hypothetical protein